MRERIETERAPKPVGAYSQGIKAVNLIFASGQIPIDPESGALVGGGAEEQARRVLDNLDAVLRAGGSSLDEAVKLSVFLTDLGWFEDVNRIFSQYFKTDPPAREVVEVARLPKGAGIEVSAIAMARSE